MQREYLAIIVMNRWLKVYDLLTLKQIYEIEVVVGRGKDKVEIKTDPLNEFLLLRIWDPQKNVTVRNSLLKINKEYYQSDKSKHPFFLFDIEVGLTEDLMLFPTHEEVIKGVKYDSIDMCFFKQKELKIATLVIEKDTQTKVYRSK